MDSTVSFYSQNRIAVTLKGLSRSPESRQSVHLLFLIDTSDSMNDFNKLENVKSTLSFLQPILSPDDRVSVVSFGDSSTVMCKNIPANSHEFLHVSSKLHTDGCTNLSAGLMALAPILNEDTSTRKKGILLLTDGHANRGVYDTASLTTIVSNMIRDHPDLTLSSIAYGANHNSDLLKQIATDGTGSYNLVDTLEDVATVFGEVLGGLTTVVAQNVIVKGPVGYKPLTSYIVEHKNHVRVGDIYSENEIIVLFEKDSNPSDYTAPHDPVLPNDDSISLSITITGSNMLDFSSISQALTVPPFNSEAPVSKSIQIASLRYDVTQILNKAARGGVVRQEARDMLDTLRALPFVSDNIIQMMIDDMEVLLERNGFADTNTIRTNIQQHAAYLGLGRGLRSVIPNLHSDPDQDPYSQTWGAPGGPIHRQNAIPSMLGALSRSGTPPPVSPQILEGLVEELHAIPLAPTRSAQIDATQSPFSNRVQSQCVQVMRTASSQTPSNH